MVEPIKKAVGLSEFESLALVKASATALVAAWEDAEKRQDALDAARRERRRLETEAGELRELNLQQRAARQEAVDSAEKTAAERDKWQKRAELCLEDDNKMAAERNEAVRKLAQAEGHNKMLRGQNQQLQAELTKARIASLYLPDGWRKTALPKATAAEGTLAANLRAQAIDDSAEPQFTAQEMSDAKDVGEAEEEYRRAARGEPTTEECPQCGGIGSFDLGRTPLAKGIGKLKCDRCKGTGRVLVADDAPKHLDTEREGAADHAMSLALDTD